MDYRINQSLKQRPLAVLGQVLAGGLFPGGNAHVSHRESQSFSDLSVDRPANDLSVQLTGCPVGRPCNGSRLCRRWAANFRANCYTKELRRRWPEACRSGPRPKGPSSPKPIPGQRLLSALTRGFQRASSRVPNPVPSTGCLSNHRKLACPRLCARRKGSSLVILLFVLPTRMKLPPGLSCCAWPSGISTNRNALPSEVSLRKILTLTGGRMESVQTSAIRRLQLIHLFAGDFQDIAVVSDTA